MRTAGRKKLNNAAANRVSPIPLLPYNIIPGVLAPRAGYESATERSVRDMREDHIALISAPPTARSLQESCVGLNVWCVCRDLELTPGEDSSDGAAEWRILPGSDTPILALKLYRHGWPWCTVADSQTGTNILTFYHQSDPTTVLIPEAVCLARLFVCESTFLRNW
ncbi:hypothetical protein PoB_002089000 [Plakobranchus ocellatus]|uniref:Uncharacterized protein n=1 Tax=Plakobranchus ocellatus TaxID=259542 RepID=A0AAV3ZFJ8_9GAST|nr:hypothetical protein PoB_002089000 [Plakobranchus ocellatus]